MARIHVRFAEHLQRHRDAEARERRPALRPRASGPGGAEEEGFRIVPTLDRRDFSIVRLKRSRTLLLSPEMH